MGDRTGSVDLLHEDDLNEMAQLIAGQDYHQLHPEHKVKIADLVLKQSMAYDLFEIRTWFEKSRLFDGIPNA